MSGARARIDALAAANPDAATLATLVSVAARVEPELLRRVRLAMITADVGAEADFRPDPGVRLKPRRRGHGLHITARRSS